MTSSEDAITLSAGIAALSNILPEYAFFGGGPKIGPLTLLTDDCVSERKALKSLYGLRQNYICARFISYTVRGDDCRAQNQGYLAQTGLHACC